MFPSPPSSTSQELLLNIYNRRLLLHPPLYYHPPPPSASPTTAQTDTYTTANGFNANVIMVLSVLLCALFCSLGLNSIIRCTVRCSTFINRHHSNHDGGIESRRISYSATLVNIGGVTKKALKTFPTVRFSADLKPPGLDTGCVICLSEFVAGEKVRLLPKCNHGFHVRCIDKWLDSHSSCPTCRSCLLDTCHKIVGGCSQASSSELPPPRFGVNVAPLAREDMVHRTIEVAILAS